MQFRLADVWCCVGESLWLIIASESRRNIAHRNRSSSKMAEGVEGNWHEAAEKIPILGARHRREVGSWTGIGSSRHLAP